MVLLTRFSGGKLVIWRINPQQKSYRLALGAKGSAGALLLNLLCDNELDIYLTYSKCHWYAFRMVKWNENHSSCIEGHPGRAMRPNLLRCILGSGGRERGFALDVCLVHPRPVGDHRRRAQERVGVTSEGILVHVSSRVELLKELRGLGDNRLVQEVSRDNPGFSNRTELEVQGPMAPKDCLMGISGKTCRPSAPDAQ